MFLVNPYLVVGSLALAARKVPMEMVWSPPNAREGTARPCFCSEDSIAWARERERRTQPPICREREEEDLNLMWETVGSHTSLEISIWLLSSLFVTGDPRV